jgi:hypothetical protein
MSEKTPMPSLADRIPASVTARTDAASSLFQRANRTDRGWPQLEKTYFSVPAVVLAEVNAALEAHGRARCSGREVEAQPVAKIKVVAAELEFPKQNGICTRSSGYPLAPLRLGFLDMDGSPCSINREDPV